MIDVVYKIKKFYVGCKRCINLNLLYIIDIAGAIGSAPISINFETLIPKGTLGEFHIKNQIKRINKMAATNYYCSVDQGFNFRPDAQDYVGHLTKLKVAGKELSADLQVTNPEEITGDNVKVVGVMSQIEWEGGIAEAIHIDCQISTKNKQSIALLQDSDLSDTSVEFQFKVYEYDPEKKKYFMALHSNDTDLKGLIAKNGTSLDMHVELDASSEVANPLNFALSIGIMPVDEQQDIHKAVSVDGKYVQSWGVTVG